MVSTVNRPDHLTSDNLQQAVRSELIHSVSNASNCFRDNDVRQSRFRVNDILRLAHHQLMPELHIKVLNEAYKDVAEE